MHPWLYLGITAQLYPRTVKRTHLLNFSATNITSWRGRGSTRAGAGAGASAGAGAGAGVGAICVVCAFAIGTDVCSTVRAGLDTGISQHIETDD